MVKKGRKKRLLFLLFVCYFTWASIFLSVVFLLHILMLNLTGGQLNPCMCFLFWIITNIKIWNKNDWFLKNKRKRNTNKNEFGPSPIWHAKYRAQLDCLSWCGSSKKLNKKTEEERKTQTRMCLDRHQYDMQNTQLSLTVCHDVAPAKKWLVRSENLRLSIPK